MTIAAGFRVNDGILLCADTQYTGAAKVHQRKLFGHSMPAAMYGCALGFAVAGHEVYAKMAVEHCLDDVFSIPANARDVRTVREKMKLAIKAIYDEYVTCKSDPSEREQANFDLVIGAWLPKGTQTESSGLYLFRSQSGGLLTEDEYCCVGSGSYLGDYLMRKAFSPGMDIKDATLLAIQALAAAKAYDSSCGGDTQFMSIHEYGLVSKVVPYDVHSSEGYISEYEARARQLLFDIGNDELAEIDFEARLTDFADSCRHLRDSWSGKWLQGIDMFVPTPSAGSQDPESPTPDPSLQPPSPESPGGSDGS